MAGNNQRHERGAATGARAPVPQPMASAPIEPLQPGAEPGVALRQALRRLRDVGRDLHQQAQPVTMPPLSALRRVIAALMPGMAGRSLQCPAAYVLAWQQYLLDPEQALSPRAVRYLCWEPTVATETRFLTYLERQVGAISSRSLQGLVWCCHTCWSPEFAAGNVARQVQQRLATYTGDHSMLLHWRQHADVLLAPSGPNRLGATLLTERLSVAAFCQAWTIDERTPYVLAVLRHTLDNALQQMAQEPALGAYLLTTLLPWSGWPADDFRAAIGAMLLHPITATTAGMPAQLTKLILTDSRLGDPRLPPQTSNWQSLPVAARQRFVHWLSQDDMTFFFAHVLPESKDQGERQAFWLRYVPQVLRSRPLLCTADVRRLRPQLRQMPEQVAHFGTIKGTSSGFILDFGALVVVQTSQLERACYVYGKRSFDRLIPDFWRPQPFTVAALLVSEHAALIPYQRTWEKDTAEILAQYDIRPTYRDTAS